MKKAEKAKLKHARVLFCNKGHPTRFTSWNYSLALPIALVGVPVSFCLLVDCFDAPVASCDIIFPCSVTRFSLPLQHYGVGVDGIVVWALGGEVMEMPTPASWP